MGGMNYSNILTSSKQAPPPTPEQRKAIDSILANCVIQTLPPDPMRAIRRDYERENPEATGCEISSVSSRCCQRGTRSCTVDHKD